MLDEKEGLKMTYRTVAKAVLAASLVGALGMAQSRQGPPWRFEARSVTGAGNNIANPEWGSAGIALLRTASVDYADGMAAPTGADRPNPRTISNIVCDQPWLMPNNSNATDFIWQWGQFIDHDITLVDLAQPLDPLNIPVPMGDPMFDPLSTGTQEIPLERSAFDPATGTDPSNPRQQMQFLTAFIDGSQVYGSDPARAAALRANDGSGRLKTSPGNLLPYNVEGFPNLGGPSADLFFAGDIRVNEQASLTVMHTLWMREHNYWADHYRARYRQASGDEIYQLARRMVGAEIQSITFNEFLPLLLGPDAIGPYEGYDPSVNPGIANEFATAAYRVGHTLLSPIIMRLEADGSDSPYGHLALRDAFFAVHVLTVEGGVEPILRGLASKHAQRVDSMLVSDVRNFLFGPPGAGGFDLAALNIQRGREHGLPSYTQARLDLGLAPVTAFSDITADPAMQLRLSDAYGDVDLIDLWAGVLSEDHVPGAMVGETIRAIVGDQFRRLRDGDRFWHERTLKGADLRRVRATRLSDVIRRNTEIGTEIQDDVFHMAPVLAMDVNDDGRVDARDIAAVLDQMGAAGGPVDVNDDGVVDVSDLVEVARSLGRGH